MWRDLGGDLFPGVSLLYQSRAGCENGRVWGWERDAECEGNRAEKRLRRISSSRTLV